MTFLNVLKQISTRSSVVFLCFGYFRTASAHHASIGDTCLVKLADLPPLQIMDFSSPTSGKMYLDSSMITKLFMAQRESLLKVKLGSVVLRGSWVDVLNAATQLRNNCKLGITNPTEHAGDIKKAIWFEPSIEDLNADSFYASAIFERGSTDWFRVIAPRTYATRKNQLHTAITCMIRSIHCKCIRQYWAAPRLSQFYRT